MSFKTKLKVTQIGISSRVSIIEALTEKGNT